MHTTPTDRLCGAVQRPPLVISLPVRDMSLTLGDHGKNYDGEANVKGSGTQ